MKLKLKLTTLILTLGTTILISAHEGVEIGPGGGRILEFSKNETMHGEVTLKANKFQIALLNKEMKPVSVTEQSLTASGGPTGKTQKLAVEKSATGFSLPVVKPGEWVIIQFKETPKAKAVTARFGHNTSKCPSCDAAEWLCKCGHDAGKEDPKKPKK